MKIPLSTVEYNLKNLIGTGLIESKFFRWSSRGKKQDIYKIKKRYIVISPGETSGLREALKRVLLVGVIGLIIAGFLEYFTRARTLNIPLKQEVITRTITQEANGGMLADSIAALAPEEKIVEPAVNVTSYVAETINEVVLPNPHYGLWFLTGLVFALVVYFIFNWKLKK